MRSHDTLAGLACFVARHQDPCVPLCTCLSGLGSDSAMPVLSPFRRRTWHQTRPTQTSLRQHAESQSVAPRVTGPRAATRAGVGVGIDIESAGESANVSVADTAAGAKKGAVRPRSSSPRAHKQQKLSAGEAAVLLHCTGLCPEGNWKSISPPLPRVQERHDAFEVHAQAVRDRGPSRLQAASNPAGREAALGERCEHRTLWPRPPRQSSADAAMTSVRCHRHHVWRVRQALDDRWPTLASHRRWQQQQQQQQQRENRIKCALADQLIWQEQLSLQGATGAVAVRPRGRT